MNQPGFHWMSLVGWVNVAHLESVWVLQDLHLMGIHNGLHRRRVMLELRHLYGPEVCVVSHLEEMALVLGEQWKKGPWLFRVYRTTIPPSYIEMIINHDKDPYQTTRVFSWLNCWWWWLWASSVSEMLKNDQMTFDYSVGIISHRLLKFSAFVPTFHGVQTYHVYLSLYIYIYIYKCTYIHTYKKTDIPLPSLPHLAPPPNLHGCWQGWEGTLQSLNPQQLLDPATAPPPLPPAPPVPKTAQPSRPRSPYLTARHRRHRSAGTAPKVRRVDDDDGGGGGGDGPVLQQSSEDLFDSVKFVDGKIGSINTPWGTRMGNMYRSASVVMSSAWYSIFTEADQLCARYVRIKLQIHLYFSFSAPKWPNFFLKWNTCHVKFNQNVSGKSQ